jgi:hypothetical protein
MSEGAICLAEPNECSAGALMCSLPAQTPEEGAAFLEWIGGAAAGTGKRLWASRNMDKLRKEYEGLIQGMVEEVERRRAAAHSSKQVAQWAVAERHKIAIKSCLGRRC